MGNCKECIFYDAKYDQIRRGGLDTVYVGKKQPDTHFCPIYPDGIPPEIWGRMKKCCAVTGNTTEGAE